MDIETRMIVVIRISNSNAVIEVNLENITARVNLNNPSTSNQDSAFADTVARALSSNSGERLSLRRAPVNNKTALRCHIPGVHHIQRPQDLFPLRTRLSDSTTTPTITLPLLYSQVIARRETIRTLPIPIQMSTQYERRAVALRNTTVTCISLDFSSALLLLTPAQHSRQCLYQRACATPSASSVAVRLDSSLNHRRWWCARYCTGLS